MTNKLAQIVHYQSFPPSQWPAIGKTVMDENSRDRQISCAQVPGEPITFFSI